MSTPIVEVNLAERPSRWLSGTGAEEWSSCCCHGRMSTRTSQTSCMAEYHSSGPPTMGMKEQ